MQEYLLIIDKNILDEYTKEYFKKYPKRKKKPIDSPLHPSINRWFIMKRPQMNALKQQWKDFTIWIINKYDYGNLHINKCTITYRFYFGTRRRHDNDNYVCKFLNDGLVDGGMLKDDDYLHVNPIVIESFYDKGNDRMEILIQVKE